MKKRLFHPRWIRKNRPGLVPLLVAVSLISGHATGALITGWGTNDAHQLEPPVWVTNAVLVSAGAAHAVALRDTGDAVAWGDNRFGQTEIPPAPGQLVSVSCGFRHSLALRADGSILAWGDDSLGQASPPAGTNYAAIAAGGSHSLALRSDGTVTAWGASQYGQTSLPVGLNGVLTIAAGGYHSLALQSNGTVVAWGYNGDGQKSVPAGATNVSAIAAGFRHSLALRRDGTVVAWGFNGQGQTNAPANLSNVVAVAAGQSQSLALREDGSVVAWGGAAGGIAVPEGLTQVQSLAAGGNFNLALVHGPAVLRQPADAWIVPGQTLTLTAFAAGSGSMKLQWQKDGVALTGQTNMSLTISNAAHGDFGSYRLRVEDGAVVVFSQVARLIAPPNVLSQPQSLGIYAGETAVFQVTATGTAPLAYRWYVGAAAVVNGTNNSVTIPNAAYHNAGNYFVVVSNSMGSVTSSVASLVVCTDPALSIQCSVSNLAFDGTLNVSASVSAWPDSFQWQLNGMDIPGATNSDFAVTHARPSIAGTYRYAAGSVCGTLYSPTAAVTVGPAALTNYVGRRLILDAGTGYGLARGFRWFQDSVEMPGQTNATLTIEALAMGDAGNYTAAVCFDVAEPVFDIARVTVLPAPPGPVILDQPVGGDREVGQSFEFSVQAWSAEPITYQWRRSGTNVPGAIGPSLLFTNLQLGDAGDYSVAVTTTAGADVSDTATLIVNRAPFLSLPPVRGGVVAWGGLNSPASTPAGLGEAAAISAGPLSYVNCAIELMGAATIWGNGVTLHLPETNLISVVPWSNRYLGLRANGVVAAWNATSLAATSAPAALRDVVQLAGNGAGSYIAVHEDGTIQYSHAAGFFPTNPSNVVQAALGQYHGVVRCGDGTVVMSTIDYRSRQTPAPAGLSNVVQVAAGAEHTLALKGDGTLVAWGRTNEGQCTVPAGLTNAIAVSAGANFSIALRSNGSVAVWGDVTQGQAPVPAGLTNVAAIAAGYNYCLAIRRGPVMLSGPHDLTIAPGQLGTFEVVAQGAPPLRYQWSFAGKAIAGATNPVLQVTAGPEAEGLYSVAVSNSEGSFSAGGMLWLGLPPEILAQPDGGAVGTGGSWTFMVLASGAPPLKYQWQANGTNIAAATNSMYVISNAGTNRSGSYSVIVTNGFGATTSRIVLLTVMAAPSIVTQPVSLTRAEGETARFTVVTSGGQPQTLQWRFNGIPLPGQTNSLLDISIVTTNHAGGYSVIASNAVGMATSATAVLAVVGRQPWITQSPADQQAHFGNAVRFTVTATGASPLQYQWSHDGQPIAGAQSAALNLTNVDRGDEGLYSVAVWNMSGSVTSAPPARLTVTIGPNVVIWGTNTLVQTVPSDLTNAVTLSASSHVLALRSDGTVAAWGLNDQGQATVPAGLSNVIAVAAGWYHSLALQADGRVVAWGQAMYGLTNMPADLTNAVAIATSEIHNLAIRSNGTVSGWGYYGQASLPADWTNIVGVTANMDATVALKGDGTVLTFGNGYYGGRGLTNIVRVMGRARMLALRNDGRVLGWGWTTGSSVEGPAGLVSADSYSVPYRQGSTTYLETHEIGLLTNGTVAVWGANRGGIFNPPAISNVMAVSAGSFFNAAVVGGPAILRHPTSQTVDAGTDVTLSVEAIGHAPLSYQWRFNGADMPGATNASLMLLAAAPMHGGQYAVAVVDPTGKVVSRTVTVLVLTDSPYVLRQPSSRSVAEGDSVSFSVEAVGSAPLSYQWLHNGSAIPGATDTLFALPSTSAGDAGFYSVQVWNSYGSTGSSNVTLALALADLIVDNTNALVVGLWQTGSNSGQIGTNHLLIQPGFGANQVEFVPHLPRAGQYQVSTWCLSGSWVSPGFLVVNSLSGASGVSPANLPGWCGLGTFSFAVGTSGSVIVSDDFASSAAVAVADAVRFRYVPSAPVITRQPQDIQAVEGVDVTLSLMATGANPLACQWQFNGVNLPGAFGQVITLIAVDRTQAGRYRALLSNTDGSVISRELTLSVFAPSIRSRLENGLLVLDWDGSATLQTSTNAAGPYIEVPDAQAPVLIQPMEAQRFFRLTR